MKYESYFHNICCNTYIIFGKNGDCAVIDPGYVGTEGYNAALALGERLKYIILTHRHADHVITAVPLRRLTGARIAVHSADAAAVSDEKVSLFGYIAGDMFGSQELGEADILLSDGDVIDVGGDKLTVMHTPGHSAGSICLVGDDVIFTGDTLFSGSMGRLDLPSADSDDMMESLYKISLLDGSLTVCPGHGDITTIGRENGYNPYVKLAVEKKLNASCKDDLE